MNQKVEKPTFYCTCLLFADSWNMTGKQGDIEADNSI